MELSELTAISAIDGRYRRQVNQLSEYFSEYALIKYRVNIEVQYLKFLGEKKFFQLPDTVRQMVDKILTDFSEKDAQAIKKIESRTNHDVKAVEYFLKEKLEAVNGQSLQEWVHFGLTSQDINNTAIPLAWKESVEIEYLPAILNFKKQLEILAGNWRHIALLSRTHGQPASPTRLGKEIMVFVERITSQVELFIQIPFSAKFGGATGNFNAHQVAFPNKNWIALADEFVEKSLGLKRQKFTTQIEHYDGLAAHFDCIKRINTILIDFSRDMWTYISMDYFKQKTIKGEVGSSTMPHKVNPIDFENAEGNLGFANAIFEHLSAKLPVSRMQRDLTDSTVLRNMGLPVAHTMLAVKSLEKGISKLVLNEQAIYEDLDNNWAVVTEAIQTILRKENYPSPYEALKELSRGKEGITKKSIHSFIDGLKISSEVKDTLKEITPHNYTGINPPF
ncbi:MAG TPA: adenylosuccinate lyase [Flavitalea sp.]|nr:adenylosuccinate lyase [Flavitalea sp.]